MTASIDQSRNIPPDLAQLSFAAESSVTKGSTQSPVIDALQGKNIPTVIGERLAIIKETGGNVADAQFTTSTKGLQTIQASGLALSDLGPESLALVQEILNFQHDNFQTFITGWNESIAANAKADKESAQKAAQKTTHVNRGESNRQIQAAQLLSHVPEPASTDPAASLPRSPKESNERLKSMFGVMTNPRY